MSLIVPTHAPLESNEERRDAVRRRAAPVTTAVVMAVLVVLAIGFWTSPLAWSVMLSAFGGGVALGRRL